VSSIPTGGMDVCSVCCVLLGRSLCDELITRSGEPTDFGASLSVIKKPRGRGGHSPRWAAVPDNNNNNNNNKLSVLYNDSGRTAQ
jgi:hypothetical protein